MKRLIMYGRISGEFLCSSELRIWLRLLVKPLAIVLLLGVMLWLGGQLEAKIAHAETIPTCAAGQEYDAGLCYPKCQAGYDGVGPVCWQNCPAGYKDDGALCRLDAHIFNKHSYGRGAGSPLTCASNEELNGGLCYPKCAATHYGAGPVCWQRCPSGYADHGATCFRSIFDFFGKNSYGRGAGRAVHTCAPGMEQNGSLCYPKCQAGYTGAGPVCWQNCPTGYKDDGALCRKDAHIFAKHSFGRGVGSIPACEVNSFTRDLVAPNVGDKFTLLIASDPQLPWWRAASEPGCTSEACVKQKAIETNHDQVKAMNGAENTQTLGGNNQVVSTGKWPQTPFLTRNAGEPFSKPLGVVVNGDLTAFWHDWQVDLYRQFYEPGAPNADPDVLKLPIFTGLGNHDYANNVNDCFGLTADKNYCAKQAVQYIKGMMACGTVSNFNAAQIKSFDLNSLAYSWELGDWHFVQLHNYPTYAPSEIGIQPSLPWLKQDLAAATAAGKKIVLNMHDLGEHWNTGDEGFAAAIKGANVAAIFGGHFHERAGFEPFFDEGGGLTAPFFLSGAAEYNTFLLAEFGDTYLNVGVVDSKGGVPKFVDQTDRELMKTVLVNDIPDAKSAGLTTAFNTPVAVNLAATDANNDPLTFQIVDFPAHGQLNGVLPNLTYTPETNFSGLISFTFKANDGKFDSAVATVTIKVQPKELAQPNQQPVATDLALSMNAGNVISVTVFCTDPENDPLHYSLVEKPSHGLLQWVGPNLITYTPDRGFVGQDHFSYKANDRLADSNIAKVTITVNAVNQAPTATHQSLTIQQDVTNTLTVDAVDPDGDALTYTLVMTPAHGVLSGGGPTFLYTPHPGYSGEDSFTYKAHDGKVDSTPATVTLNVQAVNSPPVASDLQISTSQESIVAVNLNASDVNSDTLNYILVDAPAQGAIEGAAPDLIYTPKPSFTGVDTFRFKVNDGQADSNIGTVTIHVTAAPNEASLAGLVFDDSNGNGQPDAGETGVSGLTIMLTPANGRSVADLTTITEIGGGWRINGALFGQYSLRIVSANGVQIAAPVETPVTLSQRGVQQLPPAAVQVTNRSLFLPLVVR